jgi:uncharacterized membrane protein YkvA (DUF1232 family)
MSLMSTLRTWARGLKREVAALYFAARDPRTPRGVRILAFLVVAYALSPIDLIPDFIPVLGYLDDLILVPLGIWLVVRLLPPEVLREARRRADALTAKLPKVVLAGVAIVLIWLASAIALAGWLWQRLA